MGEKAPPPLLHELLKEDQEPFHLKTYIANKQSQLKSSSSKSLSLRKRRPIFHETPTKRTNLCKHACFLSFAAASPFPDLPSPAKSPCKSPVFLHIPSRTASILVEAAMRIHKHHRSNPKPPPRTGFALLGSFLKRLKNRKRAIQDSDVIITENRTGDESVRMSCSCSADVDFEASTSSRADDDFCLSDDDDDDESCFCASPFRFSLHQSPSSTGRRTPEFFSPPPSPTRRGMQVCRFPLWLTEFDSLMGKTKIAFLLCFFYYIPWEIKRSFQEKNNHLKVNVFI